MDDELPGVPDDRTPPRGAQQQLVDELSGEGFCPQQPAGRVSRWLRAGTLTLLEVHRFVIALRAVVRVVTGATTRKLLAGVAIACILAVAQNAGLVPVSDLLRGAAERLHLSEPPSCSGRDRVP